MKAKAIMLIFLALFAAFTALAVVSSSVQVNNSSSDVVSSYSTVQINDEFVQPCGFPIDSPGGPT